MPAATTQTLPAVWLTFTFQGEGGGFTKPILSSEAPETGYQTSYKYTEAAWSPYRIESWVAFKTPSGRYGFLRLDGTVKMVDDRSATQPLLFNLDYNPSGSRVLILDNKLRINVKK